MKQQTALVFLLLFSYVLQIDFLVDSYAESSVNLSATTLSTVDRFFRTPKGPVCEDSSNISKCFNTSLNETDDATAGNEELAVTTDLYRYNLSLLMFNNVKFKIWLSFLKLVD